MNKVVKKIALILGIAIASVVVFLVVNEWNHLRKDKVDFDNLRVAFRTLGAEAKDWRVCTNLSLDLRKNCRNNDCHESVAYRVGLVCLEGSYNGAGSGRDPETLTPRFALENRFGKIAEPDDSRISAFIEQTCGNEFRDYPRKLCQDELKFEIINGPTGVGP